MIITKQVNLTEVINFASSIAVTTILNGFEYEVEISRADALRIVTAAKAADSVMNPQNNNFYADQTDGLGWFRQVAFYNEVTGTLFIGQ